MQPRQQNERHATWESGGRAYEGRRGSAGRLPHTHTSPHIHSARPSPPAGVSDEAVAFNQMLGRQKSKKGPERRLVFVSCGGNESAGTAHGQTAGWRGRAL